MNTTLIFTVLAFIYLLLALKSGKTFPVLYLFCFTYFLQYVFAPYFVYNEYLKFSLPMGVKQDPYFEYVIPALIALFSGVFLFYKKVDVTTWLKRIDARQAASYGYLLLIVSYSFDFLGFVGMSYLLSIITFTKYLKFIGAFSLLFTKSKFNYILISIVYLQFLSSIFLGGVFIDLLVWATFLFFFISLKFKFPLWLRVTYIVIALPILLTIQSVKDEYRKISWVNQDKAGLDLFAELAIEQNNKDVPFLYSAGAIKTVIRLNEGWHLGRVLKHVPNKEPFADGTEMVSDVVSSILPRVVFQDKKKVNTQAKFYQYTGWMLRGSTSMSVGLLGDFYLNFGRTGSFIMLFLFGALITRLLGYFLTRFVQPDPINIIWVPFILSFLIRADNDFYIVFNCLLKGFVIFVFINYLRKKYWNRPQQNVMLHENTND